jgi:hypothetical protein
MKFFLYFIFTALTATGAMLAGLNQHQTLLGYGIGFALWILFIRALLRSTK